MEDKSIAYEMLKTLKITIKVMSVIVIIELVIICFMGYLLYDSQFDYSNEQLQNIDNTILENSSVSQS